VDEVSTPADQRLGEQPLADERLAGHPPVEGGGSSTSGPPLDPVDGSGAVSTTTTPHPRTAEEAELFPFGRPGRPLRRTSPFYIGFVGGLGVLAAYVLAQAILQARQVLVLIIVSLFLAVGLNPLVDLLLQRGLRRSAAVAVVGGLMVLVFVGFVAAIAPPLASQTADLLSNLPDNLARLRENDTIQRLDRQYDVIDRFAGVVSGGNLATTVFGGVVGFGKVLLGSLFGALTVLILTVYFLAALPRIKHHAYLLVPRSRRIRIQLLGDEILARIGGYVAGALLIASLAGASSLVFLGVLRLEYALTLALVVAVLDLVPIVGATVGAAIVSLIALIDSPAKAAACVVFYVIYQQVENYLIYPRIMGRTVDVPPALTVIAALLGGALLGVVGALLAIPTAAAALLLFREVIVPRQQMN
jgi:predicted PurR-regulated permease PerM